MTRKNYIDMANRFGDALAEIDASNAPTELVYLAVTKGIMIGIDTYCQHAAADNAEFDKDRFLDHIDGRRARAQFDYPKQVIA